jgi:protein-S-isoprenylcysteine O-methyltransferase Ste14
MAQSSWLELKIPPPLVGACVAGLMWAVAKLGLQFELYQQARLALMGIFALAGIGFDLLGLVAFRRSRTTINPLKPERSSSLVTDGVYRVTRNPMYLGMAFLLLAWAVYLSSFLSLACVLVFVIYITRFQIQPEERVMMTKFGEEFSSYVARVRRWL